MDEFRTQLRRHNLKATRQRLAVHEVMMGLGHASPDMVVQELANRGITQLADNRIYSRRLSAGSKMFFDVNAVRHIHLYDRENHTYRDIIDEELSMLVASHMRRRKFKGFTVEDIDIQLIAHPTRSKTKSI